MQHLSFLSNIHQTVHTQLLKRSAMVNFFYKRRSWFRCSCWCKLMLSFERLLFSPLQKCLGYELHSRLLGTMGRSCITLFLFIRAWRMSAYRQAAIKFHKTFSYHSRLSYNQVLKISDSKSLQNGSIKSGRHFISRFPSTLFRSLSRCLTRCFHKARSTPYGLVLFCKCAFRGRHNMRIIFAI